MKESHVRKLPKMGHIQCKECYKFFDRRTQKTEHIQLQHESKSDLQSKVSLSDSKNKSEDYDDLAFYNIEYTTKPGYLEEITGISFKGGSEDFEFSYKGIGKMMNTVRNRYNLLGTGLFLKSVPKAGRILVEVTTLSGEKGCAGIRFLNVNISNRLRICKRNTFHYPQATIKWTL